MAEHAAFRVSAALPFSSSFFAGCEPSLSAKKWKRKRKSLCHSSLKEANQRHFTQLKTNSIVFNFVSFPSCLGAHSLFAGVVWFGLFPLSGAMAVPPPITHSIPTNPTPAAGSLSLSRASLKRIPIHSILFIFRLGRPSPLSSFNSQSTHFNFILQLNCFDFSSFYL